MVNILLYIYIHYIIYRGIHIYTYMYVFIHVYIHTHIDMDFHGDSAVKNLPTMQETQQEKQVRSLVQENPLEKKMLIYSSILMQSTS